MALLNFLKKKGPDVCNNYWTNNAEFNTNNPADPDYVDNGEYTRPNPEFSEVIFVEQDNTPPTFAEYMELLLIGNGYSKTPPFTEETFDDYMIGWTEGECVDPASLGIGPYDLSICNDLYETPPEVDSSNFSNMYMPQYEEALTFSNFEELDAVGVEKNYAKWAVRNEADCTEEWDFMKIGLVAVGGYLLFKVL